MTERVWIPAIRRLMADKGFKSDKALSDASGVRPNTLSDALKEKGETRSRIDTFAKIAHALDVPLWALFCDAREYAIFTEQVKQMDADAAKVAHQEDIRAAIRAELAPLEDALMAKLTGQPVAPSANQLPPRPTVVPKSSPKRTTRR